MRGGGRGEGKVGRFRDGGRSYCRVEFERTVLRMEIRRRVLSSILSLAPLDTPPFASPRLDLAQPQVPLSTELESVFLSCFHPGRGHCCFDPRGGPLSRKMVARRRFCSFYRSGSGEGEGLRTPGAHYVDSGAPRVEIVWGELENSIFGASNDELESRSSVPMLAFRDDCLNIFFTVVHAGKMIEISVQRGEKRGSNSSIMAVGRDQPIRESWTGPNQSSIPSFS